MAALFGLVAVNIFDMDLMSLWSLLLTIAVLVFIARPTALHYTVHAPSASLELDGRRFYISLLVLLVLFSIATVDVHVLEPQFRPSNPLPAAMTAAYFAFVPVMAAFSVFSVRNRVLAPALLCIVLVLNVEYALLRAHMSFLEDRLQADVLRQMHTLTYVTPAALIFANVLLLREVFTSAQPSTLSVRKTLLSLAIASYLLTITFLPIFPSSSPVQSIFDMIVLAMRS